MDRAAMALVVPATSDPADRAVLVLAPKVISVQEDPAVPAASVLEAQASSVRVDQAAMALVVPVVSGLVDLLISVQVDPAASDP
ncbi:MAG: hypothetical protein ABW088_17595, partial [Sedimenticola sp.]